MFNANHVVHFASVKEIIFIHKTVFADAIGPRRNLTTQIVADINAHALAFGAHALWPGS